MTPLDGAVAVITGGGSGIGRATAHSLAQRGAHVVATDIDEARALTVGAEVGGVGLRVDVTQLADLEQARDLALDRYGRVDIVMNNVGVLAVGLPEDIPLEEWQRIIDINLMGLVRSNHVFLPLLTAQGILEDRFLLLTSDDARAELARKYADVDAYLGEMTSELENE